VELKIVAEMEELKRAADSLLRYVTDVVGEVEGAVQDLQDVEMEDVGGQDEEMEG